MSQIDKINQGGCLIAAYSVYLYLKKYGLSTNRFQFVSLDRDRGKTSGYDHNRKFVKGLRSDNPVISDHFGWTFNRGKTVEDVSEYLGLKNYPFRVMIPNKLTERFFYETIYLKGWNSIFNREQAVVKIESCLRIDLKLKNSCYLNDWDVPMFINEWV